MDHFVPEQITAADVLGTYEAGGGVATENIASASWQWKKSVSGANTGDAGAGSDGVGALRQLRIGHQSSHSALLQMAQHALVCVMTETKT